MSSAQWTTRRGILISPAINVHEHGATMRGQSTSVTDSDCVLAASIDELGTVATFGVSRPADGPRVAEIRVPRQSGAVVVLTQDLESGRWSWRFPEPSRGGDQRVLVDVPESADPDHARIAARVVVKVIAVTDGDRTAGAAQPWSLDQWERVHRRPVIVGFPQVHSPHTIEVSDLRRLVGGPSLLLLHDVFGSTASTFGATSQRHRSLLDGRYEQRVWGFDHATLTISPRENADRLIRILAQRDLTMRVDIVAVGRGGLVAAELAALQSNRLEVDSIAFVGAPLGGTPLVSQTPIRRFLDRYTNLISLVPENPIASTLDAVCALATHLAGPSAMELDGLSAMTHGFTRELPAGPVYWTMAGTGGREQDGAPRAGGWMRRLDDAELDSLLGARHDELVSVDHATTAAVRHDTVIEGVSHRELISAKQSADRIARFLGLPSDPAVSTPVRGWQPSAAADDVRRYRRVPPSVRREPMHLTVVHGTVALESETVLVGHFLGTSLTGAEAAIDVRTRGRMSLRHLARLYPDSLGEHEVLPNSVDDGGTGFPKRVVIVGLGTPENLTRVGLADTVTAGLLKLALSEAERPVADDQARVINLSAPLIGTGGLAPLPVETSITAIIDGVLAANARLREMVLLGRSVLELVRFGDVRFVELQEDLAEIASRTLGRINELVRAGFTDQVELVPARAMEKGDGGWPRRLVLDGDPDWQRVVVRQIIPAEPPNRPTIAFTIIGGSAATGEDRVRPNVSVVAKLLNDVVAPATTESAATLYRLLVPQRLRSELDKADNLHFIVDRDTAAYPWEALISGETRVGGEEAISRRAGFIRQFIETESRRGRPNLGDRRRALVIGNPPTGLRSLSGAYSEAGRIAERLDQGGFPATVLRWPAQEAPPHPPKTNGQTTDFSAEILRELSTAGHRILHVAAHGLVDEQNPDRTGIVIGPESYVTADDVRNLDDVSELVFLNCCHLAAKPALAANLARAFMQSGSQAVIAAGWPVGDDTAERFADCFYLEMLEGSSFGAAVRQARRAAFSGTSESTWAAYQCYGDPGYRLQRQRSRFTGTSRMVSAAEFLRAIDIIRVRASDVGRRGSEAQAKSRATLLAELTALHDSQLGEDGRAGNWLSAVTYAALGEAAFELGDFGLAIEWYAASLRPDKALGPVKALEQLGNAQVRHAAQLARRGEPYQERLDSSLENLEAALRLGKTTERYSLLGSHWKKRAVIASGQFATTGGDNDARARDEALSKAGWYYGWAAKRAPDNPYPVFAWVQLAQLSKECTTSRRQQRFERAEKSSAEGDPDFWQRAAAGDAALTRLVTGELSKVVPDLDARVREATTKYSEAFELRSSWRERDSVLEHIRDLTVLSGGDTSDALGTLLEKLLDAIEKLGQVA